MVKAWGKEILAIAMAIGPCLSACSQGPNFASAFADLEPGVMEIRLGQPAELAINQCNRNIYAGFLSETDEKVSLNLSLFVRPSHGEIRMLERNWTLDATSGQSLVAGQTLLFPEAIEQPCAKVHVEMISLTCAYGEEKEVKPCPINVRWNWLQGFETIKIPNIRR